MPEDYAEFLKALTDDELYNETVLQVQQRTDDAEQMVLECIKEWKRRKGNS